MSDPVLNRYTSDSWSLELSAESSPLSRWTRKPVVKDEHFRLSLLGFETGSAPISWLEGDRPLLENLHQAIESYVQSNLQKPTQQTGRSPRTDGMAMLEPETKVVPMVPPAAGAANTSRNNPFKVEVDNVGHRLHYAQAGTQSRSLKLSTLQLADLLEVLDRWQGESMALPPEQAKTTLASVTGSDFVIPAWGRIAASAAIALGAATGGIYLLTSQPASQTASVSDEALEAEAAPDEFGAFPQVSRNPSGQLPNAPVGSTQQFSAPFLKQNPGQRFGEISEDSLPGLESGEVAVADATLPDASSIDLDGIDTTSISSADFLPPDIPEVDLGLPSSNFGVTPLPDTSITTDVASSVPAEVASAPAPVIAPADSSFADAQAELAAAEADLKAQQAEITAAQEAELAEAIANTEGVTTITDADLGIVAANSGSASAELATNADQALSNAEGPTRPTVSEVPTVAEDAIPDVESAALSPEVIPDSSQPPQPVASTAARAGDNAASSPTAAKPAPPVARAKPTGASQSAAVKRYFESRWSPPEDLSQPLQYQLIVSNEGSIEKMNPLSPAATKYSQEAGIPSVGDPFIPSSTDIQDATLVLTLGEDGSVNVSVQKVTPKP